MKAYMPCGTNAAFSRHYAHGEKPCDQCKFARRIYRQGMYRAAVLRGDIPLFNTAARIIIDHLETFNPMSIQELTWLIQRRHDIKDETVRRAVHRMLKDQRLASVKDWNGRLIVEVPDD